MPYLRVHQDSVQEVCEEGRACLIVVCTDFFSAVISVGLLIYLWSPLVQRRLHTSFPSPRGRLGLEAQVVDEDPQF